MDINTEVTLPLPTATLSESPPRRPAIEAPVADAPATEANSTPMLFLIIPGMPEAQPNLLAMNIHDARNHFERVYFAQQLAICEGKVGKLAKIVKMERTHLYRKLLKLGVRS